MQVGISLEAHTENIVQEPLESPKQPGTDRMPPGRSVIPLVSPKDAEFQGIRTALISREIRQIDTDKSITTGPHTPPPSLQQTSGVPYGTSKVWLSTETSAKEPTYHDARVNVPSPLVNVEGQP